MRELRYGLRTLRRSPGFTVTAILTLALGIGANVAIFSLLDQVLWRRLAIEDAERLVVLHATVTAPGLTTSDSGESVFSYPMYRDLRDRNRVFEGLIARAGAPVSVVHGTEAELLGADLVSGNLFQVLGVRPALGRLIGPEDDITPGGHPVVVLTHGFWTRRFGRDAGILNRTLLVNGYPMTVVGVSEAGFRGLVSGQTPEILVPIAMKRQVTPTWDGLEDRWVNWLNLFGRLEPGLSRAEAEPQLQAVYQPILDDQWSERSESRTDSAAREYLGHGLQLRAAAQGINQLRRQWEGSLVILMAMVGVVLLIACANVASLLIVRAAGRAREMAIRLALGAGPLAVARQVLVESLLVSLGGGLLGILFAAWTVAGLLRLLPEDPTGGWVAFSLDGRLLAFALLLSVGTCLLFGLAPAWQAGRVNVLPALKELGSRHSAGTGSARLRKGLVVAQVAMSVTLLGVAGLFARSLLNLAWFNPGFRTESLVTFSINPRLSGHPFERSIAIFRDLRQRLADLPGVDGVGASDIGLLSGSHRSGNVSVEGYAAVEDENLDCQFNSVGPETFRTLGIPLLEGRDFTAGDVVSAPKVVVVNETFARYFFGGRSAVGRRMMLGASNRPVFDLEIVGVVRDSRHGALREPIERFVYLPFAQTENLARMTFYVSTGQGPAVLGPVVRRLVAELDPALPVVDLKTMQVQVEESISLDRLIASLSTAFGLLAALLAGLGVYGVIALMVARRTAEIGIRLALGARRLQVVWLVARDVLLLSGLGIAIGLVAAAAVGRLVESQLFGLSARDGLALGTAACLMGLVAIAAAYAPVRRATRVDPMLALRHE